LTLEDVTAGYGDRRILTDVGLTAPSGQVIALVGPSGEGKSTLMRLMLGLITPEQGQLYLTDERGSRFPLGVATRQLLTYVPQGNTVLAGTVAENLRLVNPHVTEAEMIAALEDACAWEFIRELPGGLNAPVGEGGKGFSEGQAQRIAIARALVRKAPVMLLDEVTSALDGNTEQRVLQNLIRRGVTIVVSTHRPSVLDMCARIYQVRDGKVTQLTAEQMKEL
jgi:ABC-type bacteriocin/lantibiotic exporter with double-glycine peptidase domain